MVQTCSDGRKTSKRTYKWITTVTEIKESSQIIVNEKLLFKFQLVINNVMSVSWYKNSHSLAYYKCPKSVLQQNKLLWFIMVRKEFTICIYGFNTKSIYGNYYFILSFQIIKLQILFLDNFYGLFFLESRIKRSTKSWVR